MYQINMLHTLNLHNVICQLHLNEAVGKIKKGFRQKNRNCYVRPEKQYSFLDVKYTQSTEQCSGM